MASIAGAADELATEGCKDAGIPMGKHRPNTSRGFMEEFQVIRRSDRGADCRLPIDHATVSATLMLPRVALE